VIDAGDVREWRDRDVLDSESHKSVSWPAYRPDAAGERQLARH
jgi:hypothetical protein